MPLYKELWYADVNAPISPSAISAAEATSAGNKLEILQNALPVKVTSAAARNELYPKPVQGDSVYRLDLGFEERYYETYNSQNNVGGKPNPGWYEVNSGPKEIIATPTVGSGYVQYNNVFTSDYIFWKINYDLVTGSASLASSTTLNFRFTAAGTPITASLYYRARITTVAAGTTSGTLSAQTSFDLEGATVGVTGAIHGGEITLSDVFTKNYPKFINSGYNSNITSNQALQLASGYYNSTSTTIDGFRIYSANGSDLNGRIAITGYN
jgi:hypothetical protein